MRHARRANSRVLRPCGIIGRDAPAELIEACDLVTEMSLIRHPMQSGRKVQKGIEW